MNKYETYLAAKPRKPKYEYYSQFIEDSTIGQTHDPAIMPNFEHDLNSRLESAMRDIPAQGGTAMLVLTQEFAGYEDE
jgi:hypothetical protein